MVKMALFAKLPNCCTLFVIVEIGKQPKPVNSVHVLIRLECLRYESSYRS